MRDQAENLRQLAQLAPRAVCCPRPCSPTVVVSGGSAGVGTTTVAVNLAAAIADGGHRVLVVDASGGASNLLEISGVAWTNVNHSIDDVLTGQCTASQAVTPGPVGTMLLAGRRRAIRSNVPANKKAQSDSSEEVTRQAQHRLHTQLRSLSSGFDFTIVDIGCGDAPWTRRFWLQAQLVLLVTTAESSSLLDTYATIKRSLADGIGPEIRLVVNQCDDDRVALRVHQRLSDSCQRFLGRSVPAVPSLPRHLGEYGDSSPPRVWETPNSSFGHATLWLGRAVCDLLSSASADTTQTVQAA